MAEKTHKEQDPNPFLRFEPAIRTLAHLQSTKAVDYNDPESIQGYLTSIERKPHSYNDIKQVLDVTLSYRNAFIDATTKGASPEIAEKEAAAAVETSLDTKIWKGVPIPRGIIVEREVSGRKSEFAKQQGTLVAIKSFDGRDEIIAGLALIDNRIVDVTIPLHHGVPRVTSFA